MSFNICDHVEFNNNGRAVCPSCAQSKGTNHRKLNLSLLESGAYKCHAGCTPEDIRSALGVTKDQVIPTALVKPPANVTVSPQKVAEAHSALVSSDGAARKWLSDRHFTDDMIRWFRLGIGRSKVKDKFYPAISIPLPANSDHTLYYQKKRVAPWLTAEEQPEDYKPWSQYAIPAQVWFTHKPRNATATYLVEGEWDAMMLGWRMFCDDQQAIAVATFTCGASNIPPAPELEKLPGTVYVFYDRQDKPTKQGTIAAEEGTKKLSKALGDRCKVALVPMPDGCEVKGWDVSDALNHGYTLADFAEAAAQAQVISEPPVVKGENPLRSRMVSTDELIARAPEYVEWLIPDLLTADELFILGSPPRGGKSLMCMLLAKSIASGQPFLDRPVSQGSVLYVNLEDSEAKVRERVEAQQWAEGLPVYWIDKFKLDETESLIGLAKEMPDLRLIILDTLSRIRGNDVSESAAEMSQVLEPLQEFAKKSKVCILLVHHTRKLTVQEDTIDVMFDSLRGSSAIRGTCRGMLIIAPAADSTYRLAIENGWGKHDLKIRLYVPNLEWQLLGKWTPTINVDQKDLTLDFLNKVGSATIDTISDQTGVPKRSLYVVLERLRRDGMVEKSGAQRSAVYQRPVQQVQQLNSLLNSSKSDSDSDRGSVQQKNNIFSSGDQRESDHDCSCNDDHISVELENPFFVEEGGKQASNVDSAGDTAVQQNVNSSSTVELEPITFKTGDTVEILAVGQFYGKRVVVQGQKYGGVVVKGRNWVVTQTFAVSDLKLIRRKGQS